MSALLDFFTGGTARIQALLYAAIAMLVVVLALVVYGEYWRAQAWKARDQVDQVRTQLVAERSTR
jgi:membrane protein YdbS with pleckstrin-like domain